MIFLDANPTTDEQMMIGNTPGEDVPTTAADPQENENHEAMNPTVNLTSEQDSATGTVLQQPTNIRPNILNLINEGYRYMLAHGVLYINRPFENILSQYCWEPNCFMEITTELPSFICDLHVGLCNGRVINLVKCNKRYIGINTIRHFTIDRCVFDNEGKPLEILEVIKDNDVSCTCVENEEDDIKILHEMTPITKIEVGKVKLVVTTPPPAVHNMSIKPRNDDTASRIKLCPRKRLSNAQPTDTLESILSILNHFTVVYVMPNKLEKTPLSYILNQSNVLMYIGRFWELGHLIRCIASEGVYSFEDVQTYLKSATVTVQQILSSLRFGLVVLTTRYGDLLLNTYDVVTGTIQAVRMSGQTTVVNSLV